MGEECQRVDPGTRIEEFAAWFTNNGGYLNPAVEIALSQTDGYFLRVLSNQNLAAGSSVLQCPHNLTLSVLDMEWAEEPWPQEFIWRWRSAPEVLTRFFLIEQYLKKKESFWWPYIQILPQPVETELLQTPMWYEEDDVDWIKGSNLNGARLGRLAAWKKDHSDCIEVLGRCDDKRRHTLDSYTWTLYNWAATILTSRCFPGSALANRVVLEDSSNSALRSEIVRKWITEESPTFQVLIPMFDVANHDPSAEVGWEWDLSSCNLVVDQQVAGGAQVFNNYGPKGNEELIMGYGFSLPNNRADAFALAVTPRDATDTKPQPQVFYLRPFTGSPFFSLDPSILKLLASFVAINKQELPPLNVIHPNDLPNRLKKLVAAWLYQALAGQHKGIELYNGILPPQPLNVKQFHAARYRTAQLSILSSIMASLDQYTSEGNSHLLTLERILCSGPPVFLKPFRACIHKGFGTRNSVKLNLKGVEQEIFAVWLGSWAVYLSRKDNRGNRNISAGDIQNDDNETEEFPIENKVRIWLQTLKGTTANPHLAAQQLVRTKDGSNSSSCSSSQLTASTLLPIVCAAATKMPDSYYADERFTSVEFLQWACDVILEEGLHMVRDASCVLLIDGGGEEERGEAIVEAEAARIAVAKEDSGRG